MLIHAPSPDAEFAPVFGGITAEEFNVFDEYLAAVVPAVRYLKELDEGGHPAGPCFTLKLHREDRERALPAIHEAVDRLRPQLPQIGRDDRELAALVRQAARAWNSDDQIAFQLMISYLCRTLQYLLERLLLRAMVEWAVDLWLDGISAQDVRLISTSELVIRGYIYAGKSSVGSQWQEPFEAELQSSVSSPALEVFVARFGERTRLALAAVTREDVAEDYTIRGTVYSVRVGGSVRRTGEELVEWAFEFSKR